jgi:hypothetical protein
MAMDRMLLTMLLALSAIPASAAEVGGIFGQGRTGFALTVGNGYAYDNSYLVIGASATYYVINGLGVGLSFENWSGGNPSMTKYAPLVQYVFNRTSALMPYVGAFYRHTNISGQSSIDSYGERAGVYYSSGSNGYVGFGMVNESYLDCASSGYSPCSSTYPEISLTFVF